MVNFKVNKNNENFFILFRVCFFCSLAFGFCEYENPEGTLRCIRLLNGWQIQDKKLVVSLYLFSIFSSNHQKLGVYYNLYTHTHTHTRIHIHKHVSVSQCTRAHCTRTPTFFSRNTSTRFGVFLI